MLEKPRDKLFPSTKNKIKKSSVSNEKLGVLRNSIILYILGIAACTPALLSAFFEFPWRGWVDSNETYFIMGALFSTIFFFSSFYNLKMSFISHIELYFVTITAVFLSIPDIMLTTLNKLGLENREPSYSVGAIGIFIIASLLFSYICRLNYQKENQLGSVLKNQ